MCKDMSDKTVEALQKNATPLCQFTNNNNNSNNFLHINIDQCSQVKDLRQMSCQRVFSTMIILITLITSVSTLCEYHITVDCKRLSLKKK